MPGGSRRPLACWIALNGCIFVACYLNYLLQLKHRYLYKTLNVGLCLSRAAAMVINFNLLLVWLPMCKYALTWLAGRTNERLRALSEPPAKPGPALTEAPGSLAPGRWRHFRRAACSGLMLALDHCNLLHQVCASTIALASVVHTIAHLMNVINFSRNFDPLLGNLNMAEFKGQNPLQLLVSVPGITGALMVVILALMSLSSVQIIRNSSYDLFQIFHRLSILFVVLLFLHPVSHVLKEQSNTHAHHPELCYPLLALAAQNASSGDPGRPEVISAGPRGGPCAQLRPQFVAQRSICWYVLGAGLACYLADLAARRWRRSRSCVELLSFRLEPADQLLELRLSNRHRRFAHWRPGQFVYLNCPQVAAYEWHPFTVSSMDNGRFTLHIKTGGDWTRKLRDLLLLAGGRQATALSGYERDQGDQGDRGDDDHHHHDDCGRVITRPAFLSTCPGPAERRPDKRPDGRHQDHNCQDRNSQEHATRCGQAQVLVPATTGPHPARWLAAHANCHTYTLGQARPPLEAAAAAAAGRKRPLDVFIDGPFHSPFERLLDQQVSVCIANGVGWTAFSSVFACVLGQLQLRAWSGQPPWWWQWRQFAAPAHLQPARPQPEPAPGQARLHLLLIVTTLEQLRPFLGLALDYFARLRREHGLGAPERANPVRAISAYVTRQSHWEPAVRDFCRRHDLQLRAADGSLVVNEVFAIHFAKPALDSYLPALVNAYRDCQKLSVYCCGSYQVKKAVKDICAHHNQQRDKEARGRPPAAPPVPYFSYHEENF